MPKIISFHKKVFFTSEFMDKVEKDVKRVSMFLQCGIDTPSPLETFALQVLHANGYFDKE